jgi:hypothetical protein
MKFLLAALQGAVFGLLCTRLVGSTELLYAGLAAVAFPIGAMALSHLFPRAAATAGLLLTVLWTGTCGYAAYEDPSLEARLWIPLFALGGFLFGVMSNAVFFVNSGARSQCDVDASQRAPDAERRGTGRPPDGSATRSSSAASEPDPWTALGVNPTASSSEIARAFRARMALYHPEGGDDGTGDPCARPRESQGDHAGLRTTAQDRRGRRGLAAP